jgi:hypothetical protein
LLAHSRMLVLRGGLRATDSIEVDSVSLLSIDI